MKTKIIFHSNRQSIRSLEEFEAFKSGESLIAGTSYIIFDIEHPDIFGEIQHFVNYPVPFIIFNNGLNYITIEPKTKKVSAYITRDDIGAGHLVHLPSDYVNYELYTEGVSKSDMEAMEQWKSAEVIGLMVDNKPTEEILQRIKALNVKFHLSRFARNNERFPEYFKTKQY